MVDATRGRGIPQPPPLFDRYVNTSHHPNLRLTPVTPRSLRCLRHRVWMAACDDCRAAHAERLQNARQATTPPR